jgi:hypothetical protein
MRRLTAALAATLLTPIAAYAGPQTKTIQGELQTLTATVEAIEASTRTLTLKGPKGNYLDVYVPETVTRFPTIKVGDKLVAKYYENLVLRLQQPGEKPLDRGGVAVTKAEGAGPGATAAMQRTITATITAIDPSVPSITFSGPNNWTYSSRVEDRKALAKVKTGDKVDITWTYALLVGFEPAK